jgi:hypothetical protein
MSHDLGASESGYSSRKELGSFGKGLALNIKRRRLPGSSASDIAGRADE